MLDTREDCYLRVSFYLFHRFHIDFGFGLYRIVFGALSVLVSLIRRDYLWYLYRLEFCDSEGRGLGFVR